ncbi:MAG: HipA N-terminal domain-containing protein [Caedimonas sp.]|nr:HipA N-terminal domain-containing protein [Caedimonas sp.]
MSYKIDYSEVIGIKVFLERRTKRMLVGRLEQKNRKFIFTYNKMYLNHKKAIPIGQELPLTKQCFESKKIFPSFQERIPLKENPAYPEYCKQFNVSPEENNVFILLATIGRKGPSWFIFEPIWGDTFSGKKLKEFRNKIGLSTRDFGASFGISQATIVRIENNKASGAEVLRFLEILYKFPETAAYYIEKYGSALHSDIKKRVLSMLKFRGWNVLALEELKRSKEAAAHLKNIGWAKALLEKPLIQKVLDENYLKDKEQKIQELRENEQQIKQALFEIRFAEGIHTSDLEACYEFKTGKGEKSVDFKIYDKNNEICPKWLVELTSLEESHAVKENTRVKGNFFGFQSISTPWDEKNPPEIRDIIKAQTAILGKAEKFPETAGNDCIYHVIISNMRGFLTGISDDGDYLNILYGSKSLPDVYKRFWVNDKKEKQIIVGIFDPDHPNPCSRDLQKRVHAVGFINEKNFTENEIKNGIKLYHNPTLFNSSEEIRQAWLLK